MNLDKLYKLQAELDNHIWDKHKILEKMTKEELLDNTILALLVEVGELANETRCFKIWSTKGPNNKVAIPCWLCDGTGDENYHMLMEAAESNMVHEYMECQECSGTGIVGYKNPILEELADVWHFYLSIGNQSNNKVSYETIQYDNHFLKNRSVVDMLLNINYWGNAMRVKSMGCYSNSMVSIEGYANLGSAILLLGHKLGFTDEEVEQAYLKKHEENYRRQEEGY